MTRSGRFLIAVVMFASLQFSCASDEHVGSDDLIGTWTVVEAKRNARPTETLNGARFVFTENGTMETDFTGQSVSAPFEIDGDKIVQRSDPPMHYTIQSNKDTIVTLKTQFRQFDFELYLERSMTK